ncbi:hypothetical protein APJL_2053 [Actinobacillus pleuropneumoniae serovar 3 str. JL03]|uniref:Uncharacterized protein n=1 Tax=Actinobacillus pleuropneumoniae serotype 3 (strain JL03) TaxID=434271 RepID=B0BU31_ACTPJ|nr:hypothetical protein APJL_2053 [Actinobacillus pleuropneumoniae serovar 3 str. JL03]
MMGCLGLFIVYFLIFNRNCTFFRSVSQKFFDFSLLNLIKHKAFYQGEEDE